MLYEVITGTILGAITISFLKSNNYYMKRFFSLFRIQAILIIFWIIPKLPIFPNDSKWMLTLILSIVLMAFGIFNTMQNIPMITHFQLSIPDNLRARIFGVFASALFITRITSYNVCYTKLLRQWLPSYIKNYSPFGRCELTG